MTSKKISAGKPRATQAVRKARLPRLPDPPIFIGFGGTAALDWGTALTEYVQSVLVPTVGAEAMKPFMAVWVDAIETSSGALLHAAFSDVELLSGRDALRIFKLRRRNMFLPLRLAWINRMDFTPFQWELGHVLDSEDRIKRASERIDEIEQSEGGVGVMLVLRVWCAWCIADALRKWCEVKVRGHDLTAFTWKRIYQLRVLAERMTNRSNQIEAERKVLPDRVRVAKNATNSKLPRKDKEGKIEAKARQLRPAHPGDSLNKFAERVLDNLPPETGFGKDLIVQKLGKMGHTLTPPVISRKTKKQSSV